jgi:hypothetical protein
VDGRGAGFLCGVFFEVMLKAICLISTVHCLLQLSFTAAADDAYDSNPEMGFGVPVENPG